MYACEHQMVKCFQFSVFQYETYGIMSNVKLEPREMI